MTAIDLDKVYATNRKAGISEIKKYNAIKLWINSGTVDVYGSDSETKPTALSQMTLNTENTAVGGHKAFNAVPAWIAIVQNTGTTTDMTVTGLYISAGVAIS